MWILNSFDQINVESILRWSTLRQMQSEGGFQGRTNKLVDSCYSFWQGSIPAVLLMGTSGRVGVQRVEAAAVRVTEEVEEEGEEVEGEEVEEREEKQDDGRLMMDQRRLQEYILGCCQQTNGGLRDKPGKSRDNYHTCYSLSGLSVAQQFGGGGGAKKEGEEEDDDEDDDEKKSVVVGSLSNLLEPTHPVYNVHREKVKRALEYFGALGCVHEELMNSSLDCVEVDDVEL